MLLDSLSCEETSNADGASLPRFLSKHAATSFSEEELPFSLSACQAPPVFQGAASSARRPAPGTLKQPQWGDAGRLVEVGKRPLCSGLVPSTIFDLEGPGQPAAKKVCAHDPAPPPQRELRRTPSDVIADMMRASFLGSDDDRDGDVGDMRISMQRAVSDGGAARTSSKAQRDVWALSRENSTAPWCRPAGSLTREVWISRDLDGTLQVPEALRDALRAEAAERPSMQAPVAPQAGRQASLKQGSALEVYRPLCVWDAANESRMLSCNACEGGSTSSSSNVSNRTGIGRRSLQDYYELLSKRGYGASAEVWEARDRSTGQHYAVKLYRSSDADAIDEAVAEHVCMSRVASPYVLTTMGVFSHDSRPAIVCELAPQSLGNYLRTLRRAHERSTVAGRGPTQCLSTIPSVNRSECTDFERSGKQGTTDLSDWFDDATTDVSHVLPSVEAAPEPSLLHDAAKAAAETAAQAPAAVAQDVLHAWSTPGTVAPMATIVHVIVGLLHAVSNVHHAGLAHADIKPDNILLMADGSPRLADFGAASAINPSTGIVRATFDAETEASVCAMSTKLAGGAAPGRDARDAPRPLSLRLANKGTDTYSAPERGQNADMRKVDVWALGCVLYELLAGRQLIEWRTPAQKYAAMYALQQPDWRPPPLPLHALAWQPVIKAMLAVDPAARLLPDEILGLPFFTAMTSSIPRRVCTIKAFAWRPARSTFVGTPMTTSIVTRIGGASIAGFRRLTREYSIGGRRGTATMSADAPDGNTLERSSSEGARLRATQSEPAKLVQLLRSRRLTI